MNPAPAELVEVAICAPEAWIRVTGKASFKQSAALKAFAADAMGRGCCQLLFDMHACSGMDSTFLGVLASLALQLNRQQGRVVLLHMRPKNAEAVTTLGLGGLVTMPPDVPTPDAPTPVAPKSATTRLDTAADQSATAAAMLEAHETLMTLTPENVPKFKDVVTYLREDIAAAETPPSSR